MKSLTAKVKELIKKNNELISYYTHNKAQNLDNNMWPDELSLNLFSYLFSEIFFWNQCQSRISSCYACSSLLKIFRAFSDSYSSRLPAVCKHLQHSRNRHKDKAAHWREEIVPVVSWQCLLLSEQWIVCVKLNQCDPLKSHMNTRQFYSGISKYNKVKCTFRCTVFHMWSYSTHIIMW